ncbi:hypothetical protein A2U01_0056518, partial [Trifolium medium]|nr:hypothetical protein [Trifolium medium]
MVEALITFYCLELLNFSIAGSNGHNMSLKGMVQQFTMHNQCHWPCTFMFCAFREGLGNQTEYVAEYRALIL